jgi:hypothetical protein
MVHRHFDRQLHFGVQVRTSSWNSVADSSPDIAFVDILKWAFAETVGATLFKNSWTSCTAGAL